MKLYKTVKKEAEAQQIIERSRFIARVRPADTREEADAFIASVKRDHKDATHNVPAMVLGDGFQTQWASDDGEPQGTAGAPIVQMMVNEGITNTVVVVTRYFGGTKLGTGGLVRAYTGSVKLGLDAAQICDVCEMCSMEVKVEYTFLPKFQSLAASEIGGEDGGKGFVIDNIRYTDKVVFDVVTALENEGEVTSLIGNITSGSGKVLERRTVLVKV